MINQLVDIVKSSKNIFLDGFFNQKEVEFKGKKDLVTKYDKAIESYLKEKFSKEFKDFSIIAEESDNSLALFGDSIIIDPIDGTTNFVNQVPHCAISVGVYKDKKPYIGIVYNPVLEELYYAQTQKGAYLNGAKIEVTDNSNLQTALIATGFPYSNATNSNDLDFVIKNLKSVLPKCQDIRRLGSASIDLCMVAKGVFDGYYEINLKPWDVSAGIIILKEAGGEVSNIFGKEYDMFNDRCIVATNGKIHKELLQNLSD